MVFSSIVFLFLFLPVVASLYFILPRQGRNYFLLAASLFFYAWGETFFVFVLLGSIGVNYLMGLWIEHARGTSWARLALIIALVANLGILGFYKYSSFFMQNLDSILENFGVYPHFVKSRPMPIGISFFTFQAISYIVDVYRREAPPQKNPAHLALYIAMFPQLIAGPIVRYHHIAKQLAHRVSTLEDCAAGIKRFIIGLAKKVLIANTVAVAADEVFKLQATELTPQLAWLGIICYTLQIYFDFSGYSDMAIGLGRLFGFHFHENFKWPYSATSIQDFWRRWHISLSTWFRDYLYIPLGGNRKGEKRTYIHLVMVFFLCGLWHGAAWTFVLWGLYHGLFLILERTTFGVWLNALPRPVRHGYTLLVVMAGWVFFRSISLGYALTYLAAMAGFSHGHPLIHPVAMYLSGDVLLAMLIGIAGSFPIIPVLKRWSFRPENPLYYQISYWFGSVSIHFLLLFWCAVHLSAQTHNPFIYFRF